MVSSYSYSDHREGTTKHTSGIHIFTETISFNRLFIPYPETGSSTIGDENKIIEFVSTITCGDDV